MFYRTGNGKKKMSILPITYAKHSFPFQVSQFSVGLQTEGMEKERVTESTGELHHKYTAQPSPPLPRFKTPWVESGNNMTSALREQNKGKSIFQAILIIPSSGALVKAEILPFGTADTSSWINLCWGSYQSNLGCLVAALASTH